ncbi:MAG: multidrug effflux MFS transporter [Halofilum sp. (in: g-proteobacteria)]|nr:multidrug effflux MFS transporter [Halofilum sp. (in: g-proteobacteria)]
MSHARLAILLGMTVALGPLALDTYLPAFPRIAADLGVDHAAVGLTLSVYVIVLGAAQLVGGPLSDRYGRRRILLGGLALFAAASAMVAAAETLGAMLAWRVVQGVGGACCAVSVPAIVRDRARGSEAARLFGLIGLLMFIAPALAPSIGSLVLAATAWPGIFVLLAAYALLLGALLHAALFRHLPPAARSRTPLRTLVTNYLAVLRSGASMRFIAVQALAFSVLLVFITHASFIYQEWFGLSNAAFSMLFGANIAGMASVNLLNRRLLVTHHSTVILRAAVAVQAGAVLALAVLGLNDPPVYAVATAVIVAIACMGAIAPNNIANALELFPTLGGTAAAVLGATQFALAGTISALSTTLVDGTLAPVVLTMAACSLGALAFAAGAPHAMRRALAAERAAIRAHAAAARAADPGEP